MSLLSAAYATAARARRAWYAHRPAARRRLGIPVISVGNLTVGGSGKTPVVAAIARLLHARGERPAILSRGYARPDRSSPLVIVSDRNGIRAAVEQSGDEPQLLARALPGIPVVVAADRFDAGRVAEQDLGASVLVLDDGFQHVQLERDVDLLLVSGADLRDRVLPAGRLREPLAAARVADALLLTDDSEQAAAMLAVERTFQVSTAQELPRLLTPFGQPVTMPVGCQNRRVIAVAGIARPARFIDALGGQGWNVVRELLFRDHHWFEPRDIERIMAMSRDAKAAWVLMTEKDAVRLTGQLATLLPSAAAALPGAAAALPGAAAAPAAGDPVWGFVPLQASIAPADEFAAWLTARVCRAATARGIARRSGSR